MRLLIYLLKTGLCYSDSFAFCFISLSFSLPEFEDLHFTYFFLWPDVGNVFFFSTHFSFLFTQSSSLSSMISQLVFFFIVQIYIVVNARPMVCRLCSCSAKHSLTNLWLVFINATTALLEYFGGIHSICNIQSMEVSGQYVF